METRIISVHFPKAGGSSLRQSLVASYGADAVLCDYKDDPKDPCSQYSLDPVGCRRKARERGLPTGIKVVHGHFHPSKYDFVDDAKRITFVRHPVDNVISIYYYWQTLDTAHCLFNYFRDSRLTLLDLAFLPAIRYLFSRTYFGGVDLTRFDFIGFMDSYAEDLKKLGQLLSVPFSEFKENITTCPGYRDKVNAVKADKRLMAALSDCLSDDIKLYEEVKRSRSGVRSPWSSYLRRMRVITGRN